MNYPIDATSAALLAAVLGCTVIGCSHPEAPDAMRICEGERHSLAISAPTPMGPSGAALLHGFDSPREGTLHWSDGRSSGLVLALRPDPDTDGGVVEYFTPAGEARSDCARHLEIPVVIEMTTSAGELRETWRAHLQVFAQDRATLQGGKPVELLQGDADLSRFIPAHSWDATSAQLLLSLEYGAAGRTGALLLESHSEASGLRAQVEIARF